MRLASAIGLLVLALVGVAGAAAAVHGRSAAGVASVVQLRKTPLGMVLADARGRTLYMYTVDRGGKSLCYGGCAAAWPPLVTKTAKPVAGTGIQKSLLGTTKRTNGVLQVTYAHHPLYTFAFDKGAGQLRGQGYQGRWYVLTASGKVVRSAAPKAGGTPTQPAPTTPAQTTTSGGGGGGWG